MLTTMSHFLLSEWLWSVTRGGYHTPINIFVMIGVCIFILRQKTVPSVLLAVSASLFSFFLFTGIIYYLNPEYIHEHDQTYIIKGLMASCLYLGAIYAALQTVYLFLLSLMFSMNLQRLVGAIWASNLITAWIMYRVLA